MIEKECSALGGLFQTIISDMKVRGDEEGGGRCWGTPPKPGHGAQGSSRQRGGTCPAEGAFAGPPSPCWDVQAVTLQPEELFSNPTKSRKR